MLHPSTKVLLHVAPNETSVKTLYEVFSWGREALGEYLFYGEIDSGAVKSDGTGDLSRAEMWAEVSVSFEKDALSAALADLRKYSASRVNSKEGSFREWASDPQRANLSPIEVLGMFKGTPEIVIGVSGNSWQRMALDFHSSSLYLSSEHIVESRVTSVAVAARNRAASLEWLTSRFVSLCNEYAEIPFVRFQGAIRE